MLVLALADLRRLLDTADLSAALSIEGLMGTDRVLAPDLQALRPHPGQATSAAHMAALLAGSPIVASHRYGDDRVQDAYSLRCAPQVHGAARDTVDHAATVADRELAAAIDNPSVLDDGRLESHGNFHGAPLGLRARLPRHRRRRRGEHERTPHRPLPRRQPQPRPAAVPRRRPRRRLGPDDRPVHPGRDRQRAQAARSPGQRRLHPVQRDAGGPRVDGLVVRAQAAPRGGRPDACPGDRDHDRGPWRGAAGPAATGGRHRRRHRVLRQKVDGPGPDRFLAPDIEAATALVRSGTLIDATKDQT